jgi:catechol 2,3-dioxygenase-like lactoylglutathione lyase family enzyme
VDVLSSRILLRPSDLDRSRRFYRDVLGLAIYREFGPPDDPGVVFFLGPGLLEVSGHSAGPPGHSVMIWDPGTGRPRRARPAGSGRGPRRSPSPSRPATGVTAKMTNSMRHEGLFADAMLLRVRPTRRL